MFCFFCLCWGFVLIAGVHCLWLVFGFLRWLGCMGSVFFVLLYLFVGLFCCSLLVVLLAAYFRSAVASLCCGIFSCGRWRMLVFVCFLCELCLGGKVSGGGLVCFVRVFWDLSLLMDVGCALVCGCRVSCLFCG